MDRPWIGVVLALGVAGCSAFDEPRISPPRAPLPQDVKNSIEEWSRIGAGINPEDYVERGYNIVDQQCNLFFTQIHNMRNQVDFAKDSLVTAATAAGVISGIAGAGAKALTTILGATGAVPSILTSYKNIFLLGSVPVEAYAIVSDGMAEYRQKNASGNARMLTAEAMVQGYARWCTLPTIQWAVSTALKNSQGGEETGGKPPPQDGAQPPAPGAAAKPPPAAPVAGTPSGRVISSMGTMVIRSR